MKAISRPLSAPWPKPARRGRNWPRCLPCVSGSKTRCNSGAKALRSTPAQTRQLAEALTNAGHYKAAHELWRAANDGTLPPPDANSLLANGSFEQNFDPASSLPPVVLAQHARFDRHCHTRSANARQRSTEPALSFRATGQSDADPGCANCPVQANTTYCLSFAARTDALQSLSTPLVSVERCGR